MSQIEVVDPTLPMIPLKLGKETYQLCFTYAALAQAEVELKKIGSPTNLLKCLDFSSLDASTFVPLLYSALLTHQPETKPEDVAGMIKFRYIGKIREALTATFIISLADPDAEVEQTDADPLVAE